jgi:hypothetical protein
VHRPKSEGNFCDEQGRAQKPVVVTDYNWHMAMFTKDIVIHFLAECGSGQKNYFPTSWT